MYAGERERERAAAALREHYARGRLTLEELSQRLGRVLTARSMMDLRRALWGLPRLPEERSFARPAVRRALVRGAMLVALTGAYLVFCCTLLLVLLLTVLFNGASTAVLVTFLLVWLAPTWALARLWRRPTRRGAT